MKKKTYEYPQIWQENAVDGFCYSSTFVRCRMRGGTMVLRTISDEVLKCFGHWRHNGH